MPSMATSKKVTGELRKQIEEEEVWNNEYLQQKQRNLAKGARRVPSIEDTQSSSYVQLLTVFSYSTVSLSGL